MTKKGKTIVCRCEDVTMEEIEEIIEEGYTELGDIKRLLRCGMGACQGRTCMKLIAQILSRKTGKKISEIHFPRVRAPTRPIPLGILVSRKIHVNTSPKQNINKPQAKLIFSDPKKHRAIITGVNNIAVEGQ